MLFCVNVNQKAFASLGVSDFSWVVIARRGDT
jgi:hypothetical protein